MKRLRDFVKGWIFGAAILIVLWACFFFVVRTMKAQEREKGPPKPTPVVQNWVVEEVTADGLKAKLEELNRAGYRIRPSQHLREIDGRSVLVLSDDALNYDDDECEDCH